MGNNEVSHLLRMLPVSTPNVTGCSDPACIRRDEDENKQSGYVNTLYNLETGVNYSSLQLIVQATGWIPSHGSVWCKPTEEMSSAIVQ